MEAADHPIAQCATVISLGMRKRGGMPVAGTTDNRRREIALPTVAALTTQAVLTLWLFLTFCHLANAPLALQSSHCTSSSNHNGQGSGATFPCNGSYTRRAAHVLSNLHLRPSTDPLVLVTQLAQLTGVVIAVTDLLKVCHLGRAHPLLSGAPTTVNSPVRQAVSLTVRLTSPLLQVVTAVLAARDPHAWPPQQLGFQILTLPKVRTICLGLLMTNSLPYALPWRTQLWVGPIEVMILLTAMVLASEHWPSPQEGVQLLGYGFIMCCVPLVAVCWQQKLGLQLTASPRPSSTKRSAAGAEDEQAVLQQAHDGVAPQAVEGYVSDTAAGNSGNTGPSPQEQQELQQSRDQGSLDTQRQQHRNRRPYDSASLLHPPELPPHESGSHPSQGPPALGTGHAIQNRGTSLYTSPLHHMAVSVKVHHPTFDHSKMAAALQQSATTALTAALHSRLAHVSSTWVRGCVHMFMWVAQLRNGNLNSISSTGECQGAGQQQSAPVAGAGGPVFGQDVTDADSGGPVQHQLLVAAAAKAGTEGLVDVQVDEEQMPHRYLFGPAAAAGASGPWRRDCPPVSTGGDSAVPDLIIHHISPPCSALSHPSSATTVELQLSSQPAQRVRVVVVEEATGAVVVDKEEAVRAGQDSHLLLEVPLGSLMPVDTVQHSAAAHQSGALPNAASATGEQPLALRLVITTPSAAHQPHGSHPPPPARLLATATMLAAPLELASELCSLYTRMEQEGRGQGLSVQDVWHRHWQPLVNDLGLCLNVSKVQSGSVQGAVAATTLCSFLAQHGMRGWLSQLQLVCKDMPTTQLSSIPSAPGAPLCSQPSDVDSAYLEQNPGPGLDDGGTYDSSSRCIALRGGAGDFPAGCDDSLLSTFPASSASDQADPPLQAEPVPLEDHLLSPEHPQPQQQAELAIEAPDGALSAGEDKATAATCAPHLHLTLRPGGRHHVEDSAHGEGG